MADRRRINNGARIENLIPIHYPQLHQWIESLSFEQQVRHHNKCSNTKEELRVYYYLSTIYFPLHNYKAKECSTRQVGCPTTTHIVQQGGKKAVLKNISHTLSYFSRGWAAENDDFSCLCWREKDTVRHHPRGRSTSLAFHPELSTNSSIFG